MAVTRYYATAAASTTRGSGQPSTTKSAKFPWGTNNTTYTTGPKYVEIGLTASAVSTNTGASWTSLAQTTQQSTFVGHGYMALGAGTFGAGTWTFALSGSENNVSANSYFGVSIYVWRPSTSAVVGFIYDNNVQLGAEWATTTASRTFSVTGANVTATSGDYLIVEFWHTSAQGATMGYAQATSFDAASGTGDFTADGQTGLNAWIDAPSTIPGPTQSLTQTSVTNAAAFGAPTVALLAVSQSVSATSVVNANAYGTPTVTPGAVSLTVTGVANTQAFGTPAVTVGAVSLSPTGVQNTQAFGAPAISLTLSVSGVANSNAHGAATVVPGPVTLTASGFSTTTAFGSATVTRGAVTLSATGVGDTNAFGAARLALNITATAVANSQSFGSISVQPATSLYGTGTGGGGALSSSIELQCILGVVGVGGGVGSGVLTLISGRPIDQYGIERIAEDGTVRVAEDGVLVRLSEGVTPPMVAEYDLSGAFFLCF